MPSTLLPPRALIAGALLALTPAAFAAEDAAPAWRGAAAAVADWQTPAEANARATSTDPLRAALDAFSAEPPAGPAAAADAWLKLFDRWVEANPGYEQVSDSRRLGEPHNSDAPLTFDEVVAALPGPDAWPALAAAVDARPVTDVPADGLPGAGGRALRLLTAWLVRDDVAFRDAARAAVAGLPPASPYGGHNGSALVEALAELAGGAASEPTPDELRQSLEQKIAAAHKDENLYSFELPDLATRLEAEVARDLMKQVLELPVDYLSIDVGDETKALARDVATEHAATLGRPRWDLVDTIGADSVTLYEALEASEARGSAPDPARAPVSNGEFEPDGDAKPQADAGGSDPGFMAQLADLLVGGGSVASSDPYAGNGGGYGDHAREAARVYYLLGLIVQRRTDDAVRLVETRYADGESLSLPYGVTQTLAAANAWNPLFDFAARMLDRPGGEALWPIYIEAASRVGRSDDALARAETELAAQAESDTDLTPAARARLLGLVADARLAADRVGEGITARTRQIEALVKTPDADPDTLARLHGQVAQIGALEGNDAWFDRGIDGVRAALARDGGRGYSRARTLGTLATLLLDAGRGPEAEALLIREVRSARRRAANDNPYGGYQRDETRQSLLALVGLYAAADRWDDVRTLLLEAPGWGVDDLVEVYTDEVEGQGPLGGIAARALHAGGRDAQALEILTATLLEEGGNDALYALLIEMRGDDATGLLNRLRERDQFEERPLIWHAQLDLNAGRLDAAEENVRAAIAIDPSDGEQGAGDRMRAYAVLAEILRARGDEDSIATAEVMEGAVRAIRTAERADRFYEAGLLSRAVTLYEESLTHFADAYCIQSRLAVRLASMGRMTEAAERYQKAYELMPDSFGRVESHCFGCEGVFRGEEAQGIAERVFDRLALMYPLKPQVHYLRGYLASDRGRHAESLPHYRQAVDLDPDYLNAWAKIAGLGRRMSLTRAQQDEAVLNLFRLDPLGRHAPVSLEAVGDLAAAWRAVAAAQSLRTEPPATLLALGSVDAAAPAVSPWKAQLYRSHGRSRTLTTPGEMLVGHKVTEAARQVIQAAVTR